MRTSSRTPSATANRDNRRMIARCWHFGCLWSHRADRDERQDGPSGSHRASGMEVLRCCSSAPQCAVCPTRIPSQRVHISAALSGKGAEVRLEALRGEHFGVALERGKQVRREARSSGSRTSPTAHPCLPASGTARSRKSARSSNHPPPCAHAILRGRIAGNPRAAGSGYATASLCSRASSVQFRRSVEASRMTPSWPAHAHSIAPSGRAASAKSRSHSPPPRAPRRAR